MTETSIGFGQSNLVLRICLLFGACYLVLSPLVLPVPVSIRIIRI